MLTELLALVSAFGRPTAALAGIIGRVVTQSSGVGLVLWNRLVGIRIF